MKLHICTENPCPVRDKECADIFKNAMTTTYINPYYPAGQDKVDDIPLEDDRGVCDFCQEPITDEEEGRFVAAGDESLTLCESCGEHYL